MAGLINFTVKVIIVVSGISLLWKSSVAQLTVIQGRDMGLFSEQLVRDHLVGEGVSIFNVTVNRSEGIISKSNIGYFNATGGAFTQLNMKDGIIMTTGKADTSESVVRVIVNPLPVVELGGPVTIFFGSATELHAGS